MAPPGKSKGRAIITRSSAQCSGTFGRTSTRAGRSGICQSYIYLWADGIHVQARLETDAQCLLVIIGATPEGNKEARWPYRRRAGECAILERAAARPKAARAGDRA